ncbi:alkaline phosphatase D family protein [Verrucomicrobiaceae bacterium R5-34]|nr:alkaline phosphatase D family protein [Verrucomicrobiaceae bacterium R5-34]
MQLAQNNWRTWLGGALVGCFMMTGLSAADGPYLAGGVKIGEVDQTSAIVWTRLTEDQEADFSKLPILTEGLGLRQKSKVRMPTDVLPGAAGEVRVRYWIQGAKDKATETEWSAVSADRDFTHQFQLKGLQPNSSYECLVQARPSGSESPSAEMSGSFQTAPGKDQTVPVQFIVTTCQAVRSIDSGKDGHVAYRRMLEFQPDFFVHTGDILYYDKVPLSQTPAEARAKWGLIFAYGHNQKFHRHVSSYFMKDDHDTLKNDSWPGQTYGELTFDQGLEIFREQVPMGEKTYRTVRWGRDVQIWMTEHRDFRSANNAKDGPKKTILGKEQKAWLMKTMQESDATHKFLIVPGPIVGPDKKGKSDNHANRAFAHEGQELRDFLAKQKNTYVICGDRHWQYCSEDPETGVLEMGCGPINDQHMFGGAPAKDKTYHRYFGKKGGFLRITVENGKAKAEWMSAAAVDAKGKALVHHTEQLGE